MIPESNARDRPSQCSLCPPGMYGNSNFAFIYIVHVAQEKDRLAKDYGAACKTGRSCSNFALRMDGIQAFAELIVRQAVPISFLALRCPYQSQVAYPVN